MISTPKPYGVELRGPAARRFHPLGRAPRDSRPRITVTSDGSRVFLGMKLVLDLGFGEPGEEHAILEMRQEGSVRFPANVPQNTLLSVRARGLPPGAVTITVAWDDPS